MDAAQYISVLKATIEAKAPQLTAGDLAGDSEVLYSTVSSGLHAWMTDSAGRLASTTAADPVGEAARTYLLDVYQRLNQAFAAAEERIKALPTTNVNRYVPAFSEVAGSVLSAVDDGKTAITSHSTLGPVYAADPDCRY